MNYVLTTYLYVPKTSGLYIGMLMNYVLTTYLHVPKTSGLYVYEQCPNNIHFHNIPIFHHTLLIDVHSREITFQKTFICYSKCDNNHNIEINTPTQNFSFQIHIAYVQVSRYPKVSANGNSQHVHCNWNFLIQE